jgi:hypothetical protein
MTEPSKAELRKVVRLINGSPSLKFNVEVSLYGYMEDTVRSNPDLTEVRYDTVGLVKLILPDSLMEALDSTVVMTRYHNDRTQQEALEIVNYLIEQGVPANRVMPSTKVYEAVPEERKTLIKLTARQQ